MLPSKISPTISAFALMTGEPELPPMMSLVETKLNGVFRSTAFFSSGEGVDEAGEREHRIGARLSGNQAAFCDLFARFRKRHDGAVDQLGRTLLRLLSVQRQYDSRVLFAQFLLEQFQRTRQLHLFEM